MASKSQDTTEDDTTEAQLDGRESFFEGMEEMLQDVQKVADLKPVVDEVKNALKRIEDMQDTRQTSIKIGTGTRHETKVYINPSKPKEARERVETAIDLLEIGQDMLEQKEAEGNGD